MQRCVRRCWIIFGGRHDYAVGAPGDGPLDSVHDALKRRGADVLLLDQRQSAETTVVLQVGASGRVSGHVDGPASTTDLDSVDALYLRPVETERACGSGSPSDPVYLRAVATDAAMITWADVASTIVVNRPAAMAVNNSKPHQLRMIAACGFSVPDTLVTTDAVAVGRFLHRHHDVIYKSTSGVRSIVSRLGPTRRDALEDVANCPTQFQEYVPGADIRVHVVGDDILATEICSKADDYRYASRSNLDVAMVPIVLPEKVAAACRAMVHSMGLNVAGIDLRRTPDDKWYCFEVNPSPGFTFFEAATGQPIAATIANFLLGYDDPEFQDPRCAEARGGMET